MAADPRRVAFLVAELGRSGGMAVIRRHAAFLREQRGWETALVVTDRKAADVLPDVEDGVPVRSLERAAGERWDLAVATWWTTSEALWALPADRRAVFLQNVEHRFYRDDAVPDRLGAMAVLDLPVHYIVIADYMVALLAEHRADAPVQLVRNGVDKATFRPRDQPPGAHGGPLRILVEGHPTLWFKGVAEALAATAAMSARHTVTLVGHDPAELEGLDLPARPDRVLGGLDAAAMAALYAEHDVLLKLSRFEGSPLPPLEAFHVGTPVVATPFSGHEEQLVDHVNALLVGFDDPVATARVLDRLAGDRELLADLSRGALASAADWPEAEGSSAAFADALERIVAAEPELVTSALDALAAGRRRAIEVEREAHRRATLRLREVEGEVAWYVAAYEQAKATVAEHHRDAEIHKAAVQEYADELHRHVALYEEIRESRAYRLGLTLRAPLDRLRGLRK